MKTALTELLTCTVIKHFKMLDQGMVTHRNSVHKIIYSVLQTVAFDHVSMAPNNSMESRRFLFLTMLLGTGVKPGDVDYISLIEEVTLTTGL